jgi:GNAT superfamily N-acetyltransferase
VDSRYRYSADSADIDRERVHRWLSEDSYWAAGRSRARQDAAIDGSRCFAALDAETGEQVAFARVVTDGATFAWLCDVYVDRAHRGRGAGRGLVAFVAGELEKLDLRRWMLRTGDAHELYARFGFGELEELETWMARELPGGGIR